MATYQDLKLHHRLFMIGYPFSRYRVDPVPCARMDKPLSAARVALITTAGLHAPDQPGFDEQRKREAEYREIDNDIETQSLRESHASDAFDHSGIERDRNIAFPLDRFRELAARGVIGALNHRHFSFMGSIVAPTKLIKERAPEVARALKADGVDVAFLTPV